MKLLLLGGNGQVGRELRRSLAPLGELAVATREAARAMRRRISMRRNRWRHWSQAAPRTWW